MRAMPEMGSRLQLFVLIAVLMSPLAPAQRIIIKHKPDHTAAIAAFAKQERLAVVGKASGLLVLERPQTPPRPTRTQSLLIKVRRWPGVVFAEEDLPRYMHRPLPAPSSVQQTTTAQQARLPSFCIDQDLPISNNTLIPEYMPYGMKQIQATSPKLPNRTDDKGVIVCIIDSGFDSTHPDIRNNTVDGCKFEDAYAPAGCPFPWGQDFVGHGTHVAGTIAAQRNGFGVVGVIPGPAEIYVVRVFNDSGDVNQGQGLVYGSTLILAYTQCEGRLAAQQVNFPDKNYRMVVSMSLGAPGPLTIERMYFKEAAQRGDTLFVASSGNNGTSQTLDASGKLTASINPGNYPGTYPEVIAVSAVDCNNNLAAFSQKNPSVDIAAPGLEVLSTASSFTKAGASAGSFKSKDGKIFIPAGIAGSENQVIFAGTGSVEGNVVDCGDGKQSCPNAKGNIILLQYDPAFANITPPVLSSMPASAGGSTQGGIPMPTQQAGPGPGPGPVLQPLRPASGGGAAGPESILFPTRFNCELMEYAIKQGAKALLIGSPPPASGFYGTWGIMNPDMFQDMPFAANLRCDLFNCSCWPRISNLTRLPAVGLSVRQYTQIKDAVAAASKSGKAYEGAVASRPDYYQRLSGTSMAVPHASGAIARVWAAFPWCKADTVRTAFEESALDLGPKGKDVQFGHGLLQAEAAYDYLLKQPCGQGQQEAANFYSKQGQYAQQSVAGELNSNQ